MIITVLPSSINFHAIAYNEMKVEKRQERCSKSRTSTAFALKPMLD